MSLFYLRKHRETLHSIANKHRGDEKRLFPKENTQELSEELLTA